MTKSKHSKDFTVPIQRMTEEELNVAIADLEARGFELVKRDSTEDDHKIYNVPKDRFDRISYKENTVHRKFVAVMRKKEGVEV